MPTTLSALLPVYAGENPDHLTEALRSLEAQTRPAEEVVVVRDGPLTAALDQVLAAFAARLPMTVVSLPRNRGLGQALQLGLDHCRGEFVARVDGDDISLPERFEIQLRLMREQPEIDVTGSAIAEFVHASSELHGVRPVPENAEEIAAYARRRNPLNHMTVVFRRQAVNAVGGYQHCQGFEDYHLWARMLLAGCRMRNLPQVLVMARVNSGFYLRRGGLRYALRELQLQLFFVRIGFLGPHEALVNLLVRLPVRLAPGGLRSLVYRRMLRQPVPS